MPRVTPLLASSNAGEWSPLLWGRPDLAKYPNAGRRRQNIIPLPQGPAIRRPGTRFVAATKSNGVARLIPFQFSTVQAYLLEYGDQYIRFYKDRGVIEASPGVPYEIVGIYQGAQLGSLKWVQSYDTLYLTQPSLRPRKITRTGHTAWTETAIDLQDGPYLPQNTTATTLTPAATTGNNITLTASAAAGINGGAGFDINIDVGRLVRIKHGSTWGWAEIDDVTSPTVARMDIKRDFGGTSAQTAWRLGYFSTGTLGRPQSLVFHENRLWLGGSPGHPQTLWASRTGDYENFAPSDVDGTVLDDHGVVITVADSQANPIHWLASGAVLLVGTRGGIKLVRPSTLTEPITPSNAAAKPQASIQAADMMAVERDGAVLFAQRVRRKLYELDYNFERDRYRAADLSLLADHIGRPKLKEIAFAAEPWGVLWACRDDGLLAGFTYQRDQEVYGWHRHPVGGEAGSAHARVQSVAVVDGTSQNELWLIAERTIAGGTKRYVEFVEDEFRAADEDANQAAIDQEKAFFVDSGLSYDGWNADAAKTLQLDSAGNWLAGEAATMSAAGHLPFAPGDVGKVYRFRKKGVVQPAVGVEITAYVSSAVVDVKLLANVPAALRSVAVDWWGAAVTTVSGAGHLEGQAVALLVDGATHPDKTVASGAVTLDRPGVIVQLGLACPARFESLDLEAGSAEGSAQGKPKRVHKASVKLFQTLGCKVGHDDSSLEEVQFRDPSMPMDVAPPLFTGEKAVQWPKGWDRGARVLITQDQPLPLTIVSIAPQMVTSDG